MIPHRPKGYWKKIFIIILTCDWILLGGFMWLCPPSTKIIPGWIRIVTVCGAITMLHLYQAIWGDRV